MASLKKDVRTALNKPKGVKLVTKPKKKKKPNGRPTKFRPKYTEELIKYFDIEPYKHEVAEYSKEYFKDGGLKKESEKIKLMPNKMPTLYRFARSIGVDYSNVWRWAEKGEWTDKGDAPKEFIKFRNAYKEAKELQKEFLINLGLAGAAPAPFAIFTAKNVTDMRDKTEVATTGSEAKTLNLTQNNFYGSETLKKLREALVEDMNE